jgi:hypothetical protein
MRRKLVGALNGKIKTRLNQARSGSTIAAKLL